MKIKKGLEQFKGEKAMLIVAGDRRAKLYSVSDGEASLLEDLLVELPDKGDKESIFGSPKRGVGSMIAGSDMEVDRSGSKIKFARELAKRIKALKGASNHFYFFGPTHMRTILEDALPTDVKQGIKSYVAGNHLHAHPFDLIFKLHRGEVSGKVVMGDKARKMLKK
jgi:hypothetical protein